MDKKYVVSESECRAAIEGVCPGCGGEITPIETVDNAHNPTFWTGCLACGMFESGVPVGVFETSRFLIEGGFVIPYSHLQAEADDTPERKEYWLRSQTRGISSTVRAVINRHVAPLETALAAEREKVRKLRKAANLATEACLQNKMFFEYSMLRTILSETADEQKE